MKNELILIQNPKAIISEDIRTLKTNLEFSAVENEINTIMLTSATPKEGKSFISSNLSIAFANNDKKVLLIDCDLRLGRIHKIFKLSNKEGLSDLILKYDSKEKLDKYIKYSGVKNLDIITLGTLAPNPSELLASAKFKKIFDVLKSKYDLVVLDCPPVNGLSDSLILTKLVDRSILICNYGKTDINELEQAKKSLENVGANIAGVVINNLPKRRKKYDYYYTKEV